MVATAWRMRRRNRSTSGGRSRKVTLVNDERSTGSRSACHMSDSVSVMRRSMRSGRGSAAISRFLPGGWRPTPGAVARGLSRVAASAGDAGVLQLVELGPTADRVDNPLDGADGLLTVALRAGHDAHEGGPALGDERGYAEHGVVVGGCLVLLAEGVESPALVDRGQ